MLKNEVLRRLREKLEENAVEISRKYDMPEYLEKSLNDINYEFMMTDADELCRRYEELVEEIMEEEDMVKCDKCEQYVDRIEIHFVEDCQVCEDCLDTECFYCEYCESYHDNENMTTVFDMSYDVKAIICTDCEENHAVYCDHHNRMEINVEMTRVIGVGDVCQEALDEEYRECEECGEWYHFDDMMSCDYSYYCEECYDNLGLGVIGEYHSTDFDFMMTKDDKEEVGIGFELELEFDNYTMDCAKEIKEEIEGISLEHDCSLTDGFEVVSQPMSMNYFVERFAPQIDRIEEICSECYNYSHNTAGFHVHVTKIDEETTHKLLYLVEYFRKELTALSKRVPGELNHWAAFYTNYNKDEFNEEVWDELEEYVNADYRYHALNTTNFYTNEFRIFKGGLDALEIKARIELCNNFNEYARHNEIEFDNMPNFLDVATFSSDYYVSEYLEEEFGELC